MPTLPAIAFFEPRIPENTGSTIRLSAVTGAHLHLIDPLFDLSEPKLRRAGLDYHDLATVTVHATVAEMFAAADDEVDGEARVFAFTAQASTPHTGVDYRPGDVLLFGPEPTGLPDDVLSHPRVTDTIRIPMLPGRRSLNLAASASIAIYEAWRQLGFPPEAMRP